MPKFKRNLSEFERMRRRVDVYCKTDHGYMGAHWGKKGGRPAKVQAIIVAEVEQPTRLQRHPMLPTYRNK